jgi:endoglucanase
VAAGPGDVSRTSILGNVSWYVNPDSNARRQADLWRPTRPADAAQMDKIANTGGSAKWLGDWSGDIMSAVDRAVTTMTAAGALPVLVAYNIPNRDCGQFSGGGAPDAAAYRSWIRGFALGIAGRRALVVLEPDALAHISSCGTDAQRQERLFLIWDAVQVLKADPATLVYIDIGNSTWLSPSVGAERLRGAGIDVADGFATNVSNFNPTANEASYGQAISGLLGGKHFVIDTSRNGRGPASTWCNPSAQALGPRPTAAPGIAFVDAFLWVKRPGESDGTCNGGPAAGAWWADYALGLAQRAAY